MVPMLAGCGSGGSSNSKDTKVKAAKTTVDPQAENKAKRATPAEKESALRAMWNIDMVHSNMVSCYASKVTKCDAAWVSEHSPQTKEPLANGDVTIGSTIYQKPPSADGFKVSASTSVRVATKDGPSAIDYSTASTLGDDRSSCAPVWGDLCVADEKGDGTWPERD